MMSLKLHPLSRNGKSYVHMLCFLITYLFDLKKLIISARTAEGLPSEKSRVVEINSEKWRKKEAFHSQITKQHKRRMHKDVADGSK
jgi:hypothetical protein